MARILLIDDQEPIRLLLRSILERAGHDVFEASNGRHGLALYGDCLPDLVLTDLSMPEMNGLDLIWELTRGFVKVNVIAMSSHQGQYDDLQVAKLLGARHTLVKPFSMEQLLTAVRYELGH